MGAVRFCTSNLLRRRLAGMLAIAALIGLAGAVTLAAFAGARRTETAYPRLLDRVHATDVVVVPDANIPLAPELGKLPFVSFATDGYGFGLSLSASPTHDFESLSAGFGIVSSTPDFDVESPIISHGRLPRDNRAGEIFLTDGTARRLGVGVGDTIGFSVFNIFEMQLVDGSINPDAKFTPFTFTVVGTGTEVDSLLLNENQDAGSSRLSPAFVREHRDLASYKVAPVYLEDGARDVPALTAALEEAFPDNDLALQLRSNRESSFAAVSEPYSSSLLLFGLAAALATVIVVTQGLVRVVDLDAGDSPSLAALGASRLTRASVSSGRALIAIGIGAIAAVVGAYLLSPLFPLGRARDAEPDPGLHVDPLVLGVGLVAVVVVLVMPTLLRAWRAARVRTADEVANAERPVRVAERLAAAGAPASLVTGVRFAFRDPDGRRVSILTTLFGLVVAAATVVGALTFGASLDRMIDTPARYGWTWGVLADTFENGEAPALGDALRDDHDAASLTVGFRGDVYLDGIPVGGYGLEPVRGDAMPRASEGRMPRTASEIALGADTLDQLGKGVGDTVAGTTGDGRPARMHVVGITALPSLSAAGTEGLGEGFVLTAAGMRRLDPGTDPSFFLLDLAPGASRAAMQERYGEAATFLGPLRPGAILTYGDVSRTPLVLAGLLGLLGACVLVHLLVTSVRARRRDLAVLKTIGFTRRQIASTVSSQATTLVLVASVIAIPVGLVIGRWTWSSFAGSIGVIAGVVVPALPIVAVVLLTFVVGNLAAAYPARSAARTRAALVLRSE